MDSNNQVLAHGFTGLTLKWREYLALGKPKVVVLIVFTAVAGMLLAVPGIPPIIQVIYATFGIGLAAASGAALNQLIERRIDAAMKRTMNRPLAQGDLGTAEALIFAVILCILSMFILVTQINLLTALLTFISLIGYAVIYTLLLKPTTPQNIVLGGAAGATPPLLGWAAMTGEVGLEALLLFLIIFIWTPPHFWALAIRRREEYASVGVPMLPVTHGVAFTKLQILLYTLLLLAVSLMPFVIRMSGLIYLAGAIALGLGFLREACVLYRSKTDGNAMQTFDFSIFYLSMLFGFLLFDHYARIFTGIG